MIFPTRIFLTGVPGSRWSMICQLIEQIPGMNTSDRQPHREYVHHSFTGHQGAYFGRGMELEARLDAAYMDAAWSVPGGTKIVKSHDWAYVLPDIKERFPQDWIMLVYRPDIDSFAWWHEVGGFQIKYPCYDAYKNSIGMLGEITQQNRCILEFAYRHQASWHYFTATWIEKTFEYKIEPERISPDILVTVIK
jgi:hypothetical protein